MIRLPLGFQAGGAACGIKPSGKPDLGIIASTTPLSWAITTTQNRAAAPCVIRARELFQARGTLQAIVVNSGNANCATDSARADNLALAEICAGKLGIPVAAVLSASTGVIGVKLPVEKIRSGSQELAMSSELEAFASAILTTDTRVKVCSRQVDRAQIVGVAKGSGMIHPQMATMLSFICTDAQIGQTELRSNWPEVVAATFNQLSVDGDTSTNDLAGIFANGAAGPVDSGEFWPALTEVARDLAQQIARDGEGASKLIQVQVNQAASIDEARRAARAVAASPLVKTAVHGNDPNWGRVLAALGNSGAVFAPQEVQIFWQGTLVYQGRAWDFDSEQLSRALASENVLIEVNLGAGSAAAEAFGCDLSAEYVRINSLYTT